MVMDRLRGKVVAENLNRSNNIVGGATFSIGTETTGNVITVSVQLQDENGNDIAFAGQVPWWLSSDAAGQTVDTAPTSGTAAGTDGTLIEWTANISGLAISESDGDIDFALTDTGGGASTYLNIGLGNGKFVTSGEIAWAT